MQWQVLFLCCFWPAECSWCYIFTWKLKRPEYFVRLYISKDENRKRIWSCPGSCLPHRDPGSKRSECAWRAWEEKSLLSQPGLRAGVSDASWPGHVPKVTWQVKSLANLPFRRRHPPSHLNPGLHLLPAWTERVFEQRVALWCLSSWPCAPGQPFPASDLADCSILHNTSNYNFILNFLIEVAHAFQKGT